MFDSIQEAFDKTVAHLARQKKRAFSRDRCVYLADDGSMCAVGCHIPADSHARHVKAGYMSLIRIHPELKEVFGIHGIETYGVESFWLAMQQAHDDFPKDWTELEGLKYRLNEIAVRYSLNPNIIETITDWSY